jgi:hypothetical protein
MLCVPHRKEVAVVHIVLRILGLINTRPRPLVDAHLSPSDDESSIRVIQRVNISIVAVLSY